MSAAPMVRASLVVSLVQLMFPLRVTLVVMVAPQARVVALARGGARGDHSQDESAAAGHGHRRSSGERCA